MNTSKQNGVDRNAVKILKPLPYEKVQTRHVITKDY